MCKLKSMLKNSYLKSISILLQFGGKVLAMFMMEITPYKS